MNELEIVGIDEAVDLYSITEEGRLVIELEDRGRISRCTTRVLEEEDTEKLYNLLKEYYEGVE